MLNQRKTRFVYSLKPITISKYLLCILVTKSMSSYFSSYLYYKGISAVGGSKFVHGVENVKIKGKHRNITTRSYMN